MVVTTVVKSSMRRLRLTLGLWIRTAVACAIAGLGVAILFPVEIVAVAAMVLFSLFTLPLAIGVTVPPIIAWYVVAGLYRRATPAPLVAGRIDHDGMADAVDRFAGGVTRPSEFLPPRALAAGVAVLAIWAVGYAAVESSTLLAPLPTAVVLGVVVGVATAVYHTGRTIYDELGSGGTVQRRLEEGAGIVDSAASSCDAITADLQARVDRLANQAGVPAPTVRVGPDRRPFAATAGIRTDASTIVVSRGLVESLDDRELEAVLAHELAHVVNRDAAILTLLSLPVAKVDSLIEVYDDESAGGPVHHPFFALIGLIVAGFNRWSVAVVTRYREYVADRGAVAITGDPAALATALETLDAELEDRPSSDLRNHRSTAAFSIVPPPWEEHRFFDRTRRFVARAIFGTHPPTEKRIERLRDAIDD